MKDEEIKRGDYVSLLNSDGKMAVSFVSDAFPIDSINKPILKRLLKVRFATRTEIEAYKWMEEKQPEITSMPIALVNQYVEYKKTLN